MKEHHHPYLFKDISEEDYAFLKETQLPIIDGIRRNLKYREGADEEEMAYFEKNKPSLAYNRKRQCVSICLKEGRIHRLILSQEDIDLMSPVERKIFFAMRNKLEEILEGIKIRKEDWE
jgi:hypothetical protein